MYVLLVLCALVIVLLLAMEANRGRERNLLSRQLEVAVEKGDLPGARLLLSKGAEANGREYETSLLTSMKALCLRLFGSGTERSLDNARLRPLQTAAKTGNPEMCRVLLSHGADIDGVDSFGRTALMYAAGWDHYETAYELVSRGADIHRRDRRGSTATDLTYRCPAPEGYFSQPPHTIIRLTDVDTWERLLGRRMSAKHRVPGGGFSLPRGFGKGPSWGSL